MDVYKDMIKFYMFLVLECFYDNYILFYFIWIYKYEKREGGEGREIFYTGWWLVVIGIFMLFVLWYLFFCVFFFVVVFLKYFLYNF